VTRLRLPRLASPARIQSFLDDLAYSTEHHYRSPASVLRDRMAHCFDGAVFAAAALARIGHEPMLLDLEAVRDDDHVLAVYRVDGCWGALAKSNCSGLRWREPVYRTPRELAMSYFEDYFNVRGERTLRRFSSPVSLARFGDGWLTDDAAMEAIADRLIDSKHHELLTKAQARRLARVDERTMKAGFLGSDPDGLYQPG
jgi:hypothetical protein